jgi:hypothetical protein
VRPFILILYRKNLCLSRDFFVFLLTKSSIYDIIKKVKSHYRLFRVYQMIMVVSLAPSWEVISMTLTEFCVLIGTICNVVATVVAVLTYIKNNKK